MYLLYFVVLIVSRTHGRPSYHTYGRPYDYPTYGGHAQSYYSTTSDEYNDWFFEMEPHHEPSGPGFTSKMYETFHQIQDGVHMYAPALHVGKINRGHYPKPELLQPRHRVMGYNSDFNQGDTIAFRFTYSVSYCQAQPKPQPANPQLGAEIALFSQLWETTLHPTRSPE